MISIINNKFSKIDELCRRHRVKKLYLFGSAGTSKFNSESDIDFLISFEEIPLLDYADNYFELQEALERTLNRRIDLVVEKSIKNPYLKNIIERTKTLVYG